MASRRARRLIVVLAGGPSASDQVGRALTESIASFGVATHYLGREVDASRIAAAVVDLQADAVDLCLAGGKGVQLLRQLLRELIEIGRRDVSIVVHRVD
jgi:methylmalonyl-CoA mutase cobalamin-binding subunit